MQKAKKKLERKSIMKTLKNEGELKEEKNSKDKLNTSPREEQFVTVTK